MHRSETRDDSWRSDGPTVYRPPSVAVGQSARRFRGRESPPPRRSTDQNAFGRRQDTISFTTTNRISFQSTNPVQPPATLPRETLSFTACTAGTTLPVIYSY